MSGVEIVRKAPVGDGGNASRASSAARSAS